LSCVKLRLYTIGVYTWTTRRPFNLDCIVEMHCLIDKSGGHNAGQVYETRCLIKSTISRYMTDPSSL